MNRFDNIDCMIGMTRLEDKSIDMILCDLPYGTTACKWDTVIPFEPLWENYKRLIKDNGAIVLFGSQPFTTDLINSNREWFKYEMIWDKMQGSNFFEATTRQLKSHENILIFYKKQPLYNAQMTPSLPKNMRDRIKNKFKGVESGVYGDCKEYIPIKNEKERYPLSVYYHSSQGNELHKTKRIHNTQKPVALFEYLIKTYTNEGETVLDNCAGSGTTGVACLKTNRNYIMFELDKDYYDSAQKRLKQFRSQLKLAI